MDVQKISKEFRFKYWTDIIKEYHNSGQSVSSWCEEHNVNVKSYYYWLKKIRTAAYNSIPNKQSVVPLRTSGDISPVFAQIKAPANEPTPPPIILRLNGAVIEIQDGASSVTIENTLKALKSLC